jgi:hypothetical protein
MMIIYKAHYGLRSSGLRWHEKLADILRGMGFFPSRAEEDIWMRDMGDHYEYIAVYVDDLAIASKDPQKIIDSLEAKPHELKLKGTGPMTFHLGCDFYRDDSGTLCFGPKKYIEKMEDAYQRLFGSKPKHTVTSPLEKNDHPELDETELLDNDGISRFQSLIGQLQWAVSLGRFDVATAVMTMSSYRVQPREGHMERAKRMIGYLSKMKHACIRVRTEEPEYSDLPETRYDWETSIYGNTHEELPEGAPRPLGKPVVMTTYVDANLYHDYTTGRAVTGILRLYNQTPMDWYTKKQGTVETATYGAEFVSARTARDQIVARRIDLRYLGVHVKGATRMFGDNESVVKSGSIPHSRLNKRHVALSYHSVREAIAAGIISFSHIPGAINPSDILSKHWGYQQVWPTLKPILFWEGDTAVLLREEHDSSQRKGSNKDSVITSHDPNEVLTGATDDVSDNRPITSKPVHESDNNCQTNNKATSKCVRESVTADNDKDIENNDKDPKDP